MNDAESSRILAEAVAALREHFDTVQIFVTRHDVDAEGTLSRAEGSGNYFARYGLCEQWVNHHCATIEELDQNDD